MKTIIALFAIISIVTANTQEIPNLKPILTVRFDTITTDSAKMSFAEIYDYHYIKKKKLPQCLSTVDTLLKQINDYKFQTKNLKDQYNDQKLLSKQSDLIIKEKEIQLNLERAKNRQKIWGIVGGTAGGIIIGVLVGVLIPK